MITLNNLNVNKLSILEKNSWNYIIMFKRKIIFDQEYILETI